MLTDAIVLAGGRSTRLGGTPKAELLIDGRPLLDYALAAVATARRIVVVGPAPATPLPAGVLLARERPLFAGPAAAIAAGLAELAASNTPPSTHTLVIACDMPRIAPAVALLMAADGEDEDGVIGVDGDRLQPLAARYRSDSLAAATDRHANELAGLSMFRLIGEMRLAELALPEHSADDIDTWADAEPFGAVSPGPLGSNDHPTARSKP